jgi:hypothetical protein
MRCAAPATHMLCVAAILLMPLGAFASQRPRHHVAHRSLHSVYPGALHYAWHWVRVQTAVGAPTGGAPVYYYSGGYLPGYGAAYPYYSAGYAPGYGCSMDYHFQDGYCYPN